MTERACGGQERLRVAAWVDDKITHMAHEVGDVIKEEMGGMWQVTFHCGGGVGGGGVGGGDIFRVSIFV